MEKTLQVTKKIIVCDACKEVVKEQYNYSDKVERLITAEGKIMTDVDVCGDCLEEGTYKECQKCKTLVHDDYAFESMDEGIYYCVNCADIVLEQLEDRRIRCALERNRLLATMTE